MSKDLIERIKKFAGLDKDKDRCPPNPNLTVREVIELADRIEQLEAELAEAKDNNVWRKYYYDAQEELAALKAQSEPVAWKHDCAALLQNDVELWIDRCPHCGKPHQGETR
jgi:hypothetical protein